MQPNNGDAAWRPGIVVSAVTCPGGPRSTGRTNTEELVDRAIVTAKMTAKMTAEPPDLSGRPWDASGHDGRGRRLPGHSWTRFEDPDETTDL